MRDLNNLKCGLIIDARFSYVRKIFYFFYVLKKGKNKLYSRSLVGDEQLVGESHRQRMARSVQANRQAAKRQKLAE